MPASRRASRVQSGRVPLVGSERPRPDTHKLIGPADADTWLGVTVLVRPRPGSSPPLDLEQWHAIPLAERDQHVLTREQYAEAHGADPADLDKVAAFAAAHRLKVVDSHAGRRAVTLEGTAAQFNAAFGVTLKHYEAPIPTSGPRGGPSAEAPADTHTHVHHGHDGQASVPVELDGVIIAVVGLDNRIRSFPAGVPVPAGANAFGVPALAASYKFPTSGAADQTIGIFAPGSPAAGPFQAGSAAYDGPAITGNYFSSLAAPYNDAPTIHDVQLTVNGSTYGNSQAQAQSLQTSNSHNNTTYFASNYNGGILELTQDISTSSTIAHGATINVYFNDGSEQGWLLYLNRILQPETEKAPSVASSSFTFNLGDEANGSPGNYSGIGTLTTNPLTSSSSIVDWMTRGFQALASVGVDVFIALGDWGADNWWPLGNPTPVAPDGNSHVMYPGSDPWITSCGGTVLGSSKEVVWGYPYTTGFFGFASNRAATGGGVSKTFVAPTDAPYQTAAGITGAVDSTSTKQTGRGVPDVAGHVALNGFFANPTVTYNFIGTSCVAPFYAGLAAVLKSALGQQLGPLNDTLYALPKSTYNDITLGNNSSGDTPTNVAKVFTAAGDTYSGNTPNAPYFTAAAGWDACTGLGSIDGTKLLNGISSLLYSPNFYFQVQKGSFGLNEVSITPEFSSPTPLWLVLEGFTPNAITAAGVLPAVDSSDAGFTVTVGAAQWEIATALDTPQRVYFPCTIKFAPSAITTIADGGIFPAPGSPPVPTQVTLTAQQIPIGGQLLPAAGTRITLEPGADPYFANYAHNGSFYISQDLRVFTVTPGINKAPIDGVVALQASSSTDLWDTSAAYTYIQQLLKHLNSKYAESTGPDPFTRFPDQTNALSGDSSVTPTTLNPANPTGGPAFANYNFAVARVRLDGTPNSSSGANVRVLFRVFAAETGDTDFQPSTYPSLNDTEGQPLVPQLGTDNVTIPFFATGNFQHNSDYQANADYKQNHPSINNQPVKIGASGATWAYYGCYLNFYPPGNTINGTAVQSLLPSSHSCVVAQLIYDDAPAPTGPGVLQGPEWSSNFAQRNLQITFSDNPGPAAAHRVPQTFDTRPGPAPGSSGLESYPDELMIAWGGTPVGSTASIYWPAVASADVLALADKLYSAHQLSAADANTIQCTVPDGFTCVPIPAGAGANFAGLFTIEMPLGVTSGETFTVTVRRISTSTSRTPASPPPPPPPPPIAGTAATAATAVRAVRTITAGTAVPAAVAPTTAAVAVAHTHAWRYVVGTFAVRIPVTTAPVMLPAEEDTLAIMRWRLAQMAPSNRWIPVLKRYIGLIEGRLKGVGGDPSSIKPSPYGAHGKPSSGGKLPGRGTSGPDHDQPGRYANRHEATGKVTGVVYDRFGDFDGFLLLTEWGEERAFRSREAEIESLVRYAWLERTVITVWSELDRPEHPIELILRRAPRQPERPWP